MGGGSKKKIESEFDVFFPAATESARVKQYYTLLQKRTIQALQRVRGKENEETIQELDRRIFEMYTPKSFSGKTSAEVKFIKAFEEAVIYLHQFIPKDPKSMNVLEFYQTLEVIKKQQKRTKK